MAIKITRRDILKTAAVAAASGLVPLRALAQTDSGQSAASGRYKRVLRFAHLTDSHVQPELGAPEGLARCIRHALGHADKPKMIVHGGDHIMSAFGEDAARTKLQWDLYQRIFKDECPLPVESCIGNHDIWGWDKTKSGTTGSETNYGKKWAMDVLGLSSAYRTFDRAGWRFIILDSVQPDGALFRGELAPPQFEWLKEQLSRTPHEMPVIIVSHIPIFSTTPFMAMRGAEADGKDWKIPALAMHIDARRIMALFDEHPSVRLCLSGHTHLLDRVEYNGVTYICDGTICGAKWRGPSQRTREGYGMIDLFADGSFAHQYHTYGWEARG